LYVWGALISRVISLEITPRNPNFLPLSNFVSRSIFLFNKSAAACKRQLEFKRKMPPVKRQHKQRTFFPTVLCIAFFRQNCSTDNNNYVIFQKYDFPIDALQYLNGVHSSIIKHIPGAWKRNNIFCKWNWKDELRNIFLLKWKTSLFNNSNYYYN
jgi:hypothetical protein